MSTEEQKLIDEQTIALYKEISAEARNISAHVVKINKKIISGEMSTAGGNSFLELKHQLLLHYLLNMAHMMHCKVSGQSIKDSPDRWRLIEIRTVLEKMRPIERKMKPEIDRLLRIAEQGELAKNDPLSFKPNPGAMMSKVDESDSDSESGEGTSKNESGEGTSKNESGEGASQSSKSTKLYVPPRLQPMYYDGDKTRKDKQQEKLEQAKKRALHSSIMHDLLEEYSEAPKEIHDPSFSSYKLRKEMRERNDYEEDRFVRLAVSKKTKSEMKKQRFESNIDKLTNFGDISALEKDYDPTTKTPNRGTKRKAGKGKKSSKGKKRGRFGR